MPYIVGIFRGGEGGRGGIFNFLLHSQHYLEGFDIMRVNLMPPARAVV